MLSNAPEMLDDLKIIYTTYRKLADAISRYAKISHMAVYRHHAGEAISLKQPHYEAIQKLWTKHFKRAA